MDKVCFFPDRLYKTVKEKLWQECWKGASNIVAASTRFTEGVRMFGADLILHSWFKFLYLGLCTGHSPNQSPGFVSWFVFCCNAVPVYCFMWFYLNLFQPQGWKTIPTNNLSAAERQCPFHKCSAIRGRQGQEVIMLTSMVRLPILSEEQMLWECAGLGPSSGKQISSRNPLVSMDCQMFLWTLPGPLKKSQVHARIQTHLPPLYLSSASDRTTSTHTALPAITHSCHSLLSP